jgi:hypothetical protein
MPKISPDLPPVPDVDEATVRAEMREFLSGEMPEMDAESLEREVEREVEKWRQSRRLDADRVRGA